MGSKKCVCDLRKFGSPLAPVFSTQHGNECYREVSSSYFVPSFIGENRHAMSSCQLGLTNRNCAEGKFVSSSSCWCEDRRLSPEGPGRYWFVHVSMLTTAPQPSIVCPPILCASLFSFAGNWLTPRYQYPLPSCKGMAFDRQGKVNMYTFLRSMCRCEGFCLGLIERAPRRDVQGRERGMLVIYLKHRTMMLEPEEGSQRLCVENHQGCSTPLKRKIDSLWIASQKARNGGCDFRTESRFSKVPGPRGYIQLIVRWGSLP